MSDHASLCLCLSDCVCLSAVKQPNKLQRIRISVCVCLPPLLVFLSDRPRLSLGACNAQTKNWVAGVRLWERSMEPFCVAVDGRVRTVCGLTLETTCDELTDALCQATGKTYEKHAIYEVWRSFERLVRPDEQLLQLRAEWGLYESDVTFVLKPRSTHKRVGPCVRASKLRRRRGYRGVPRSRTVKSTCSRERMNKICLQRAQVRNQRRDIRNLESELASLRDAVDRFRLTEEERVELSDLRALSEQQEAQLEETRLWEEQIDVQTREKETYDEEIDRLRADVALGEEELARCQKDEQRLLAELRVLTEARRRSMRGETEESETERQINQLSEELKIRIKANARQAVKVRFNLYACPYVLLHPFVCPSLVCVYLHSSGTPSFPLCL